MQDAWDFFSSPQNLSVITPARMNFKILSMTGGNKMFAGQVIQYKVSVLPLVRVKWVTEITQVNEPHLFVDEQRTGPYSLWHHEHHFKEVPGGLEMTDHLTYAIPFRFLGELAHSLFVERELKGIFDYRYKTLQQLFPVKN
jgi:ligand-binding SRPBCC domain-containing protein